MVLAKVFGYLEDQWLPEQGIMAPSRSSSGKNNSFFTADYSGTNPKPDDALATAQKHLHRVWGWAGGRGRRRASGLASRLLYHIRRNLVRRRLLSFPHLLVALWFLIILWGERWIFASKVSSCHWSSWEQWPKGATPHRLIFVADPQIIDPHSYPGRPWPINPLTMMITDNYMRKSYVELQKSLHPDTIFFLGDLFDGGREWAAHHDTEDPSWSRRPQGERKYAEEWKEELGDEYWLSEYARFKKIFFDTWNLAGSDAGPWQRGRKLIASLPGNHDLGFGDEIKPTVRRRFNTYFGDVNRVDVIGNHSFVSVDTVSLSADDSIIKDRVDLQKIYAPAQDFLRNVQAEKRRAAEKEMRYWRGEEEDLSWQHVVEDLEHADFSNTPSMDLGLNAPDFPTILLTHVPLYRDPGTPCGPKREHWPPAKPAKGQKGPVVPDHRNAIRVAGGYQYQNVLTDTDSQRLVNSIGNVVHAFSGDDHDYCELVHTEDLQSVLEITVKSFSMAMGVPTPGFEMVSLYNPVDDAGKSLLAGDRTATIQTHLCLLPSQLRTYMTYAILGFISVSILTARAFLMPLFNFEPFALDPDTPGLGMGGAASSSSDPSATAGSSGLPVYKAKTDEADDDGDQYRSRGGNGFELDSTSSGTSASRPKTAAARNARTRGPSLSSAGGPHLSAAATTTTTGNGSGSPSSPSSRTNSPLGGGGGGRWGGPRIQIRRDYDGGNRAEGPGAWRPAARRPYYSSGGGGGGGFGGYGGGLRGLLGGVTGGGGGGSGGGYGHHRHVSTSSSSAARSRDMLGMVFRELWTTVWRVVWMVLLFFAWVTYRG